MDSLFNEEYAQESFIGAGVTIILEDEVAYENAFGYRDYKRKLMLDEHSIFRIGSVSKSLTGVLSGILFQQGRLSYNAKIKSALPDFRLMDDAYEKQMTLRHLLSHSGGFPYHSYTNLVEANLPLNRIISSFRKIEGLVPPGTVYSYQNAAFAVAGEFMAMTTGTPIAVLFQQELFKPLKMTSTSVDYKSISLSTNKVMPHSKTASGWQVKKLNKKYYNAIPSGGINTTTRDMGSFLQAVLGNHPHLFSLESIDQITDPVIPTKVDYRYYTKWPNFKDSYYGLGWRIHTFEDTASVVTDTIIHHGGMVNGYRSEIAFHRKERFAICVMFNSYSPFARDVIPRIIEIIRETDAKGN